jgi:hypothetical protein
MTVNPADAMASPEEEAAARSQTMPGGATQASKENEFLSREAAVNYFRNKSINDKIALKIELYFGGFYKDAGAAYSLLGSEDFTDEDVDALQAAMIYADDNQRVLEDALQYRGTLGRENGGPLSIDPGSFPSEAQIVEEGINFEQDLRGWALSNGIPLSDDFIKKNYERVMSGGTTATEVKQFVREKYIAQAYPAFREEILAGFDIKDLAFPYVQSMASMLELPEDAIGLDNPLVKQALQGVDEKGNPSYMPMWQFERQVRQDPRWANTTSGRNEIASLSLRVLQDFGLMG